ncbi:MAG: hypothetical protein WDM84_00430 [Bauldia sp.]
MKAMSTTPPATISNRRCQVDGAAASPCPREAGAPAEHPSCRGRAQGLLLIGGVRGSEEVKVDRAHLAENEAGDARPVANIEAEILGALAERLQLAGIDTAIRQRRC